MNLIFKVKNNTLYRTDRYQKIPSGNNNIKCNFCFTKDWSSFDKKAIFNNLTFSESVDIIDNYCIIPENISMMPGEIYVGIVGENTFGERMTTDTVKIIIKKSIEDVSHYPKF